MTPAEVLAEAMDNVSLIAIASGRTASIDVAQHILSILGDFGWHLVEEP